MRLYNPAINLGGEYIKVKKNDTISEIRPMAIFEVTDKQAKKLLKEFPFLKKIDDPLYEPDYHLNSLKKPNWFKRLWHKV